MKDLRQSAINLIPELEDTFNINMSIESFINNDIPNYFDIVVEEKEDVVKVIYNFEISQGSAQIIIENFGTSSEYMTWNNILQIHLDNESSIFE